MAETTTPSVKKYHDYANQQIDEQAILDKYNAATVAQFNAQREQNRIAENKFYNEMYNTQKTAMDTIRQANANAVSTGASRGVQAANELSALLGLQSESVASATELAQANRQTAQEETAAVLENVLQAYQQAQQERSQLVQQGIEAASVDVQQDANKVAAQEAQTNRASLVTSAAENGAGTYITGLQNAGIDYSDGVVTPESTTSLNVALNGINVNKDGSLVNFEANDWKDSKSPVEKGATITTNLYSIIDAYGLDRKYYEPMINDFIKTVNTTNVAGDGSDPEILQIFTKYKGVAPEGVEASNKLPIQTIMGARINKTEWANAVTKFEQYIKNTIYNDYINGINRRSQK